MKAGRLAVGTQNFPFSICHLSFVIGRRTKRIQTHRGPNLVFQVHELIATRSHPVQFDHVVPNGRAYDAPAAPIYFVLGTGGDPRTATCWNDSWVAVCRARMYTTGFGHFPV